MLSLTTKLFQVFAFLLVWSSHCSGLPSQWAKTANVLDKRHGLAGEKLMALNLDEVERKSETTHYEALINSKQRVKRDDAKTDTVTTMSDVDGFGFSLGDTSTMKETSATAVPSSSMTSNPTVTSTPMKKETGTTVPSTSMSSNPTVASTPLKTESSTEAISSTLTLTTMMTILTDTTLMTTVTPETTKAAVTTGQTSDAITSKESSEKSTMGGRSNSSPCSTQKEVLTDFGKYGVLAFGVSVGFAALFLYLCLTVLCLPRYINTKKKKKKRLKIENISDMQTPSIYRPPPSQIRANSCIPTPLAMIISNDPTSNSSNTREMNTELKGVLVTDLDAVDDQELSNGPTKENADDRKYSSIDPSNVSTFLLRQTSIKLEDEKRRKSLTESLRRSQHGGDKP